MMTIDPIIAQMKESGCLNCECDLAIFDETGVEVCLTGSFCEFVPGHLMIEIKAKDLETGNEIWSKLCETGQMCNIPFTSDDIGFKCF